MPGARCARCRVCNDSRDAHTRWSGHTGITRHSPRNGFTAYNALSRVTGLFATLAPKKFASRGLDASVGASGPHAFAVRLLAPFVKGASASTATRSAFVTIAKRPSGWNGMIPLYCCFYPAVKRNF